MAKKSLGQHFLKNESAIRTIAGALELTPHEIVFEIGPGHGELTNAMRAAKNDVQIIAIEQDKELAGSLEGKGVEIIHGDALEMLPRLVGQLPKSKTANYKIAGNIPYYITGHLLRIISELEHKPERCVFTIQKEVAERIIAQPPDMNRLAASVQFWAEPKIVAILPATDFKPVPKVASAIIALRRKKAGLATDQERYYAAVRMIFAQPRKTILNNLMQKYKTGSTGQQKNKEGASLELSKINIDPASRPQDLSIENIADIAKGLF